MNARVIILTSALAAVACTKPEDRSARDRAAGTTDTAAATTAKTTSDAAPAPRTLSNGAETAGQTRDANNAGANDRDRQVPVAAADQGSSAAETEITAAIRKGILADDTLTSSPDVKVATVGTRVTLRGPVHSDQAKLAIAEIATRTVGVREVDNQLVVKN